MSNIILQDAFLLILLVGFSVPLGRYIDRVMSGQRVFLARIVSPLEIGIYRLMGIRRDEEMGAKKYALSVLVSVSYTHLTLPTN
jgi:K+-transporting ATPase ATPase A chain